MFPFNPINISALSRFDSRAQIKSTSYCLILLLLNASPLRIIKSDSGNKRWGFKIILIVGGVKATLGEESFILKERLRFLVRSRLV